MREKNKSIYESEIKDAEVSDLRHQIFAKVNLLSEPKVLKVVLAYVSKIAEMSNT